MKLCLTLYRINFRMIVCRWHIVHLSCFFNLFLTLPLFDLFIFDLFFFCYFIKTQVKQPSLTVSLSVASLHQKYIAVE